jgi:hypothetical protein
MPAESYISGTKLVPSASRVKMNEPLTLDLQFKVDGRIREVFNQQTWTDAYNKHDNMFRIKYVIRVQTGSVKKRDIIEPIKFARKASFYWSRNPKLPPPPPNKKIWAMIVIEDIPNLPDSVEQARSLIFDVKRPIELIGSSIGKGKHKLIAHVSASWEKHLFTEPMEVDAKSNEAEIVCV